MPRCIIKACKVETLRTIKALYLHIQLYHKLNLKGKIKCPEHQCLRAFNGWRSFRRHLLTFHKFRSVTSSNYRPNADNNRKNNVFDKSESNNIDTSVSNNENYKSFDNAVEYIQDFALSFVAKFYANPNLSRNIVQDIIDNTHDLLDIIVNSINLSLISYLESKSVDQNILNKIQSKLELFKKPFKDMETEYLRLKKFQNSGYFIKSDDYIIGNYFRDKIIKGRIIKKTCDIKAKFISMRNVLRSFLSLPGVLKTILDYMDSLSKEKGIISNFIQGELWQHKIHTFFQGKIVLPLFIYYDDLEVCNPLGSHASIQKLGAVFYSIPCLPPQFLSQLENIFLALLFHSVDRSQFSNTSIFTILVDEINYLQKEGLKIQTREGSFHIYFALGLVLGDNLGLNSALGFTESFNATYFCRFCKMTKNDSHSCPVEKTDLLRTEQNYNNDLLLNNMKETGVKENSVWNKVNYFHVTANAAVDKMHDFDEGVYKYGMSHILYHYIYDIKNVSLNTLNERLKGFDYASNNISNRLPSLREDEVKKKKLSFSASEMSYFLLLFPFIVGEDVCHDDVWEYYLILRKIHDLINAKYLQEECAELLGVLIEEHHVKYCNLFMDNLKAKHHNMTHYKTVMKKSGPPSHLSVARFESKNRLLKLAANATCSRKNITHTLATKEQFYLCYRFLSTKGLIDNQKLGPILFADNISFSKKFCTFKNSLPANFMSKCLEVSWAEFRGIIYKPDLCVVLNFSTNHLPQFGIIRHVFCNDSNNLCLVCQNLLNIGFCEALHGYEVEILSEMSCVVVENLCHPFPAIIARLPKSGILLVSTKHAL